MIREETQSINAGGRTFYLIADVSTRMVVGHSDEERKAVLHELGLDGLLKPYASSVTAWVKEQLKEFDELPEPFTKLWEVNPYSNAKANTRHSGGLA